MILAGDIGGTNSRLAIFDDHLQKVEERIFKNAGRPSLIDIVDEFVRSVTHPIDRACFAVAGPVSEGKVTMNNLSWHIEEGQLAKDLKIEKALLINDLRGHAEGIAVLGQDKFITLWAGRPVRGGGRAVVAAGTGLGEAGLAYDAKTGRYLSYPTEGGHTDFSPTNDEEDTLFRYLRTRFKRVYWELMLSGRGLRNLYDFYCATGKFSKKDELPDQPAWAGAGPSPADISSAGVSGSSPVAVAALEFFVRLYGAEAGNFGLKTLATAGIYLGGGIAPRIAEKFKHPDFLKALQSKGSDKIEEVMKAIPVHIINFELSGLYGAANYARHM
ncbi:MAG TPA: glucokinase [Tepidisphaeraceae bacterium]|nr:glucokinase [Tepidisphaeraceae bacterium]